MKLKTKNLILFPTKNMNFRNWEKVGMLSREIAPYNLLAKHFKNIFIFTYAGPEELKYQKFLSPNIKIICKNVKMPIWLYYWLAPLFHLPTIFRSHFLKTNQMRGAKTALIAKFFNPFAKLIIRTGFTQSLFDKKENPARLKKTKRLEKWAYRLCDHAFITSLADRDYILKEYKIPENKISVIPNYIDTEVFKPEDVKKFDNRVLFIGKIHPQKNLPALVESLSNTGLALDIVGQESKENKLTEELVKLAFKENAIVNFLGAVPNYELPKIINKYKIFVLPSLYEGMPKTLLEAMSCGLACIATDIPGSREVIKNGVNGLLAAASRKV